MKNYNSLLLTVLLMFVQQFCFGQKNNSISVIYGVGQIKRQDLTASPLIHKDWTPINVGINYQNYGKVVLGISLSYELYKTSNSEEYTYYDKMIGASYSKSPHNFNIGNMDVIASKKFSLDGQSSLYLGGGINVKLNHSSYNYGRFASTVFNYMSSLYLPVEYSRDLLGHISVSIATQLPIILYVSRSPYLTQDDDYIASTASHKDLKNFINYFKGGSWHPLPGIVRTKNHVAIFNFMIQLKQQLNQRFDIALKYKFQYSKIAAPMKFVQVENSIVTQVTFKI